MRYYCPTPMVEVPSLAVQHRVEVPSLTAQHRVEMPSLTGQNTGWKCQFLLPNTQGEFVKYYCPTHRMEVSSLTGQYGKLEVPKNNRVEVPNLTAPHTEWRCQVLLANIQDGGAPPYWPIGRLEVPNLNNQHNRVEVPNLTTPRTEWRCQVLLANTGWRCQVLLPNTRGGGAHPY